MFAGGRTGASARGSLFFVLFLVGTGVDPFHGSAFAQAGSEFLQGVAALFELNPVGDIFLHFFKGPHHSWFDLRDLEDVVGVFVGNDRAHFVQTHGEHDGLDRV